MIFTNVFSRETGLQGCARLRLCDSVFGRFVCRQHDEHLVEPSSPSCPGLACSFSKVNLDHLAIVDEEGGIRIVDTQQIGAKASLTSWLAHENAIFDVDWMPGESQLLTASGDKTIVLWDLAEEKKLATFEGHVCSVKTAKFQTDSKDIFVSGSRDGHVMVWDKRTGQKVVDIADAHRTAVGKQKSVRSRGESQSSQLAVTGVLFQKADTFISVGGTDGVAKVWDLRKISSVKSQPVPKYALSCKTPGPKIHGLSSLVMDSRCTQLFVSSMGSIIYQFDCINYKPDPVALFSGHEQSSFYIKATLSPDDSYLVSGSSDQNAYIWSVADPKAAPVMLKGQTAEVSAVAWCPNDLTRIVTVNDAGSFWIWRIDDYSSKELDDNVALHVFGQAERKVVHQPSGLRTPRKVLPPRNSPAKVLPINPKSLQNLPRNSRTSKKAISSPSILNYFGKPPSPAVLVKPMFTKSPRKLLISPSKPLQTPGISDIARAARYSSAKRKLCTDDEDLNGSCGAKQLKMLKISKTDAENSSFSYHPPSPGLAKESLVRVLNPANTNVNVSSSPHPADKIVKEGAADEKLTLLASNCDDKTQLSPRVYMSPTYNLPNANINSTLHTPVRQSQLSGDAKPIDWLTQMRIDRQKQNDSSLQSSTTGTPGRTPNKTPSRTPGRTPKRTPSRATSSTPKQKVSSSIKGVTRTPNSCKRKTTK